MLYGEKVIRGREKKGFRSEVEGLGQLRFGGELELEPCIQLPWLRG